MFNFRFFLFFGVFNFLFFLFFWCRLVCADLGPLRGGAWSLTSPSMDGQGGLFPSPGGVSGPVSARTGPGKPCPAADLGRLVQLDSPSADGPVETNDGETRD